MGVGRINIHSFYDNYAIGGKQNNNNLQNTENVQIEQTGAGSQESGNHNQTDKEINKAPAHSDPKGFAFDFENRNRFNLVAATNSMEDVDIKKAVSDMEKDPVLDQYKFFIGTTQKMQKVPNLGTDADGTVTLKMVE
ncbi:hypothetical protein [Lachnospira eligens]|jgi:hypothetical protein|uniref:Uncharacterized protein n=1 Tax=Lachnospira eligens TaxID=39485 RepID=A0A415MCM9_9FIRM|nr:hypothetical protein [Lachnospira eligens]RHA48612.1 hypothetical protein DW933_07480 [Lachnospira eligens]RHL69223.1 hypothetical protein DW007_06730 [Lachnospira eligens]